VKKEGQTSKAAKRKNRGENAGLFLILLLLHSLSLFTSLSLVFWIFGKVVKEEKEKKKKKKTRERKMTKYCPQILSTKIDIILKWLHLSLCDHLLGI
jgi:flagellar basal body-associated protein FliL